MDERIIRKNIIRKQKKRKKYKKITKIVVIMFVLALFTVFLIDKFVISVLTVSGNSMQRTLYKGDKILVQKISIDNDNLEKGDIVYFIGEDKREYLKRIIAGPGDVVEIVNEKVLVNGIQNVEEYTDGNNTETYSQNKWFVEDDEYFVLGDNRQKNSSKDSRIFGTINIKQIKGKVIYNFSSER